jgi:polysaccharide deacetylase 2 family uncharacterized protein YibQ
VKKFWLILFLLAAGWTKPKLAVVIDDCGYSLPDARYFAALKYPLTLAVIPGQAYSRACALEIKKTGQSLLIHFPWTPLGENGQKNYPVRIEQGYPAENMARMLEQALAAVPDADGINNHQGSVLSADREMMDRFMRVLRDRPETLYFLDSGTAPNSQAKAAALRCGIPAARNDLFLDGTQDDKTIAERFAAAVLLAERKGNAVAICHAGRPATKRVLKKLLAKYNDRVQYVHLPEIMAERLR